MLVSCLCFALAYRFYGAFLIRRCGIDDSRPTPAHTHCDRVDYMPTRPAVLFGHHFSSIAGAGPIVGPVLAATYFGWGPTWMWILLGAIFVGGVHDFGSALISARYQGRSIAETTRALVGRHTAVLLALFFLLALIYVIIVFLDLAAGTFSRSAPVATSSVWFIAVALLFGLFLGRRGLNLKAGVLIFVPLTFAGLAVGVLAPLPEMGKTFWVVALLGYCWVAAVLPVNVLLQPRDFLSSTFLYAILILGIIGLVFSGAPVEAPAFTGFFSDRVNPGYLVPMLFITVACGACSGFHSMVASGTTAKQMERESDTRRVVYGAMLFEGVLAVFAMLTVAILVTGQTEGLNPVQIFSTGASVFLGVLGIPQQLGMEFTALAVSTFLLTTLDTCTRLCRYLLEEMTPLRGTWGRMGATLLVLVIAGTLVFQEFGGMPAWQAFWPLFGATNQLMGALALVTFLVFLRDRQIRCGFAIPPLCNMVVMPLAAFALFLFDPSMSYGLRLVSGLMLALGVLLTGLSLHSALNNSRIIKS